MKDDSKNRQTAQPAHGWLARWTTLQDIERSLVDEPSEGFKAWARTTAGVVAMLLALQLITGVLLAFYYVPSTESAHTTVAYIEKVLTAGAWLRALHHYGSQWLTLFLVLHIGQMFWRASYRRRPVGWTASVVLLALIMASGATGYSLPWDARAFFSTRIAEGITSGMPLAGSLARRWLLGGSEISALTLTRFFALHALVLPTLILLLVIARLFIFRERGTVSAEEELRLEAWMRGQIVRNAFVAGLIFLALALYAAKFHAPFGPAPQEAAPEYLPRPGAQFLWLFQTLKFLPGRIASLFALLFPLLFFASLAALPFLDRLPLLKRLDHPRRSIGATLFAFCLVLFTVMTALAYIEDARDPRVREQLARQRADEAAFRAAPFEPQRFQTGEALADDEDATGAGTPNNTRQTNSGAATGPASSTSQTGQLASSSAPAAYIKNCANCHGTHGQGVSIFPKLLGVYLKPRRSVEDIVKLLDDPVAYGLRPPMKSYAGKLTEDEKLEIANFVVTLKKKK
ncbi:MAG TPA: cytochrome b N-terminal domain-containing protein [Pyrinomonadaceae bacterium]|jgi:ubiquinol-cytochrome c reductase cytochrome b subunit